MSTQDDVVDSLMSLYCLFVTLGYLTKDEISWPPHDAAPFNVSRCVELGYDPSAIELLRRIPWATEMLPIYYESIPVDYSCDDELEGSRDPMHYLIDYPDDPQPVDGWILPLTYGQTKGQTILLDAREGTIRVIGCYGPSLPEDEWPRPDNPGHYTNWEPQPAAPFIKEIIREYTALECIPANGEILVSFDTYYARTKAAIFEYGWPDNFRTDDFRRDIEGLQQKWHHECTAQIRERVAQENLEELTKNVNISETDQ